MKIQTKQTLVFTAAVAVTALIIVPLSFAKPHDAKSKASEYSLREVMQHLQSAEEELHLGILTNNRLMIRAGALRIADHPAPKGGLKPYIKKNQEKLMETIKAMDQQVHHTAKEIAAKAEGAPVLELLELEHKMVSGCVGCHNIFRD